MQRLLEHRFIVPATRRYARPLLLLHGAWHAAWCWEPALHDFARRGFAVHAFSLRGHGASATPPFFNLCGIDAYLCDIATAVERIQPTPIVVAHSMGGFLLQHYLAQHTLPGAVLLCALPHSGAARFLAQWLVRHPRATLQMLLTLNSRHLIARPDLARKALFRPDTPDAMVAAYASRLGPEAIRAALELMVRLPRRPTEDTPLLVVAAEQDTVVTIAEQQALATRYAAELLLIPGATHSLMFDPAWPLAAEQIERTAQTWMQDRAASRAQ